MEIRKESSGPRGADPAIAVAVIALAGTLLAPFVTELAKKLFSKESELTIEQVDHRSGLGSTANMRKHFDRLLGTTPSAYRSAFRSTA